MNSIMLVVLAGLYMLGYVGYYKLSKRLVFTADQESSSADALIKFVLLIVAVVWPVATFWALVKEAAK